MIEHGLTPGESEGGPSAQPQLITDGRDLRPPYRSTLWSAAELSVAVDVGHHRAPFHDPRAVREGAHA